MTTELADAAATQRNGGSEPASTVGWLTRTPRASFLTLGGAALLVGGCIATGRWLVRHGVMLMEGSTYVVFGRWQTHWTPWVLPAVVVALATVGYAMPLARRLPWPAVPVGAFVLAGGWATALALVEGPRAIAAPISTSPEYLRDVPRIRAMGLGTFLRIFSDHVVDGTSGEWTTHVGGHPPLMVSVFVLLATIGLGATGWAAALCIVVGASAAASILSTVRLLAGEQVARRAAPFVAVAPLALWVATSADAFFAGVAAGGICALAHAGARRGMASVAFGVLAGVAFGACLNLSYGLVLLAPIIVAVAFVQRRVLPLVAAAVGVALVIGAFALGGFWWLRGFEVTRTRVIESPGYYARPAPYYWFADPAVVAICVGPAVVAAFAAIRQMLRANPLTALVALPLAALTSILFSIVSNLAKGEVERIYLPFTMWLLPLAALLPARSARGWLAATCGWTLLIAFTTHLHW